MQMAAQSETQPMLGAPHGSQGGFQGMQQVTRTFGGAWKVLFSTAALAVIAAGVVGFVQGCATLTEPFETLNQVYLILFGLLLIVLDMPSMTFASAFQSTAKFAIYKYALLLTRFTGRGLVYLFLAAVVVGTLWTDDEAPVTGFIFGGYIVAIGVLAIYKGITQSIKLDRVRRNIKTSCAQRGKEYINMICPGCGLTGKQFSELIVQMQGDKFSEEEMSYVMNALSMSASKNVQVVQRNQFIAWTHQTRMTLL
eukprot:GEMP01014460.1.p1 GENE.GEMP01014460.1~~GEMP01014460.1.p1  ORF type:complete len:253 (+),score=41.28 GEMP01014460.1:27-785(+)